MSVEKDSPSAGHPGRGDRPAFSGRRSLFFLLLILFAVALLSIAALIARQRFLTRGLPDQLPGPIAHASVSPYGINVEMLDWEEAKRDLALARIAAAGFRWIKQPVSPGDEERFGHLLEAAALQRLQVVPLLDGDPATNYAPPVDPTDWAAFAGRFAARYGKHIRYYQIWDEPNLGSHWGNEPVNPAGYAALLAAAHDAIKAADPDAVIIAAALAPTEEQGPENLSDLDYLAALYDLGAGAYFDVAAGKPYGFYSGPDDRRVERDTFNFSRLILLREVMEAHNDAGTALWAGNLGWNALPENWAGAPSVWGATDLATQAAYTREAYRRASAEWPWAGVLFLENYAPAAPPDDPRWGFALVDSDLVNIRSPLLDARFPEVISHYQRPDPDIQSYQGGWRFDPSFGADISQSGDRVRVEFEGTDFGVRVRRGDYRAYIYITIDGAPANALPDDERGAYLALTSPNQRSDDVVTVPVARHLAPGRHTAEIVAERGWDQWALAGFSAADLPDQRPFRWELSFLSLLALGLAAGAIWSGRGLDWSGLSGLLERLGRTGQLVLTAVVAALFALSGWLTWLDPAGGAFRRLGDGPATVLTAAVAALFYLSPWLLLNIASGLALFLLILWRLEFGLALIALSAPFYVYPKPLLGLRFSPVELFTMMTFAAWVVINLRNLKSKIGNRFLLRWRSLSSLDLAVAFFALLATVSLLFTERLDVASNEWRVVVLEPALFYLLLRAIKLDRPALWRVVDGFVLGGVIVALLGLFWYATGSHIITAEGGLPRLRSIYGSPNNVGLFLGRVVPILLAILLTGRGRRRWLYGLALLPTLAAAALSFSKGALLLGLPVGIGLVLLCWRGRRAARVLGVLALLALIALLIGSQIPALEGRLSLSGATTDFRVSLWKASAAMIADHPWTGVGLDNFLYQYRGRYIRPEAWQEPSLSHPHNIFLDFWSRLGILGLAAILWLQIAFWRLALGRFKGTPPNSRSTRPLLIGLIGTMGATLAHGLVDQTYFLIDLAYAFMLTAGLVSLLAAKSPEE
jgi:O-antigen ligase